MNNCLDPRDQSILAERIDMRDKISGPRQGDYIQFSTGELERFSHDWGDDIQTSPSGSFYLHGDGDASFSGGLNPSTPIREITLTDISLPGEFWFFHHCIPGAGRGVHFKIPCRLYRTTAQYTGFLGEAFQSNGIDELKAMINH